MTADRNAVKQAVQTVAVANQLTQGSRSVSGAVPRPIFWPALHAGEARAEWDELRDWVALLRARFPNLTRIPECWWQHNDLVEVLAALRDCERGCYHAAAPATAPVEWHRALREMELRLELWIKRLTCTVPGRGHDAHAPPTDVVPDGWDEFVARDIARRQASTDRPVHDS